METLHRVGNEGLANFVKLSELEKDRKYKVLEFFVLSTKFGRRIGALLETGEKATLPKRFSDLITTNEQVSEMNNIGLHLVFKGIDTDRKNMNIIDLVE